MTLELVDSSVRAARALERRRTAADAIECPSHWLLDSAGLEPVVSLARRIAKVATTPVLIQGERGCGVQELARLIHDADPVARLGRFRTVASKFVGQAEMRGSIQHGTLLIEDVENLRLTGQTWLLSVLAERDSGPRTLRVVGSSRFSVAHLLQQGQLSQELIYALDVSRLIIPSLRERPAEILPHAERILSHYGGLNGRPFLRFAPTAERKLLQHSYPGNLSELRNVVERAVALGGTDGDVVSDTSIVFYDQPPHPGSWRMNPTAAAPRRASLPYHPGLPSMEDIERDYLIMLIREFAGRRTAMARAMGVSYPTVLKKIAHHRLDVRAIAATALQSKVAAVTDVADRVPDMRASR
jgi:DNA-binding NtrC family response regulator